jgi:hypothetical protein
VHNRLPPITGVWPPSIGDKLVAGAYGCDIELIRFRDEEGNSQCHCDFRLSGSLGNAADARQLLRTILREFDGPASTPDTEGGAA